MVDGWVCEQTHHVAWRHSRRVLGGIEKRWRSNAHKVVIVHKGRNYLKIPSTSTQIIFEPKQIHTQESLEWTRSNGAREVCLGEPGWKTID